MSNFDLDNMFNDYFYRKETSDTSKKALQRAKSEKTGAGLGGLLLPIILTAATGGAAAPWMLALAGAGGAYAGSKIGGESSGVSDEDIYAGDYNLGSKIGIQDDLAGARLSSALKSGLSAGFGTGKLQEAGKGFKAGSGIEGGLLDKFIGGAKGFGEGYFGDVPYAQAKGMTGNILEDKGDYSILDITKRVAENPEIVSNPASLLSNDIPDATNTDVPGTYTNLLEGAMKDSQDSFGVLTSDMNNYNTERWWE
tara:strand:+ start:7782 stop:8540 length:759 start_codon:yes stop_codon:yes gene_type:complete